MKSLDFLKEGFVEDANEAHQDHEVQMARQECFHAAEHALALHKLLRNITEAQGLEGWVSSKITLANDYLRRVREYLEYELLTNDIANIESVDTTIAESSDSKKKIIEYKIVAGGRGQKPGSESYVVTGIDPNTLKKLASSYYQGEIELQRSAKNPKSFNIIWNLPTAGPTPYGSYDAQSQTATLNKKMTDAGDQLAISLTEVFKSNSSLQKQDLARGVNHKSWNIKAVSEGHADQQRKVFKKNGKPVGEVGIDRESSPGVGQWYMKCYLNGIDHAGYDSYQEAVAELKYCLKQDNLTEGTSDLADILAQHSDAVERFKQQGDLDYDLESDLWEYYFNRGDIKNYDADASGWIADQLADELGLNEQGVAEGGFDNASPMTKDSIKADRIRSLKNLIAIAKEKGRQLRVQELELELKKLQGVAEGIDIGQEWMSDTELDDYVPIQLQDEWRELLGFDEEGNPHPLWVNMTGDYEPNSNDPQHRAWMVKVANKWFAMKKIPNVKFYDVRDIDDELEWLVKIGQQGVAEGKKPDRYHIVGKDGKPADLASYADRASAEQVRDKKYPDAVVQQVGPRGKVKGVAEGSNDKPEAGDKIIWYHSNHYPELEGEVVGWKDGHLIVKSIDPSPRNTEKTVATYRVPKNNIMSVEKQGVAEGIFDFKKQPMPEHGDELKIGDRYVIFDDGGSHYGVSWIKQDRSEAYEEFDKSEYTNLKELKKAIWDEIKYQDQQSVAEGSLEEVSLDLAKRARDKAEKHVDWDEDDMRDRPEGYSEKQRSKFQRYIDRKEPRAKGDRDWDPLKQGVAEGKVSGYKMYPNHDGTWYVEDENENVVLRNASKGEAEYAVWTGNEKLKQGVAEGAKCNHTMKGTKCPVHGLKECGSYGKVEEMSVGSVATVVNPPAKNKSKVGTLFGGTYKQKKVREAKQITFPGEKTKPPQKPGDQVRGTEKATKPNPFKHRLVGNGQE